MPAVRSGAAVDPASRDRDGRRVLGAKGEATRTRLLEAAEEVFGTSGYHAAAVSEITRKAGVAQGTFYVYFESKLEIFRELVRQISQDIRRVSSEAAAGARDRLEAERLGQAAFFRYVHTHRNVYKVLREAEFVDEELFRWYYHKLAEGYTRRLTEAMAEGQVRSDLDPEALSWAVMGVAHMIGMRYVLWEQENGVSDRVLASVMDFIFHGMAPKQQGGEPGSQ